MSFTQEDFSYFMSNIGNEVGVFAIAGNVQAESGWVSNNLQNYYNSAFGLTDEQYTNQVNSGQISKYRFCHDSAGYGLAQWTYWSRKQSLYEYTKGRGHNINDRALQREVLMLELQGKLSLLNLLKTSDDLYECTKQFMLQYENPADQSASAIKGRVDLAKTIQTQFTGTSYTPIRPDSGGDNNGRVGDGHSQINYIKGKQYEVIHPAGVNIRSKMAADSKKLGAIPKGTKVHNYATGRVGDMIFMDISGTGSRWICADTGTTSIVE